VLFAARRATEIKNKRTIFMGTLLSIGELVHLCYGKSTEPSQSRSRWLRLLMRLVEMMCCKVYVGLNVTA
jgi:hypothetical protein